MTDILQHLYSVAASHPWASFVTVLCCILSFFYWILTNDYGKFEAKGLFSVKPQLFFGNNKDLLLQRKSQIDFYRELYQKFKGHKYGIIYEGLEACFFAKHPDIIKQILIRDFDHFENYGFAPDMVVNMPEINLGLINSRWHSWKSVKSAIAPAFSPRNMKNLSPEVHNLARQVILLQENAVEIDLEKVVKKYVMECVTKLVFGITLDTDSTDSDVFKSSELFMEPWKFTVASCWPWAMRLFNIHLFEPKSVSFLTQLGKDIIAMKDRKTAEGAGLKEDDVIGLMIKIRNDETTSPAKEDEQIEKEIIDGQGLPIKQTKLSNDNIASQIMQFFADGYSTVASTIILCVYFLATNPEVQQKATEEVDKMAKKMEEQGTLLLQGEEVNELEYLDQVVSEAARLGSFPVTNRVCTKDWQIPGTDVILRKGMRVMIPICGVHTDPSFYPEPYKFIPDRFSSEKKSKIVTGSYLPFGMGPRMCVGIKMARLEAKMFIFELLRNYRSELAGGTKDQIVWRKDHFMRIEGGCWVKLFKRGN